MKSFFTSVLFLALFAVVFLTSNVAVAHVWHFGKHAVEGEFVNLSKDGRTVTIKRSNGKTAKIQLRLLCKEDQNFVRESIEDKKKLEEEAKAAQEQIQALEERLKFESKFKPGQRLVKTINGVDFVFHWCPAGKFTMGANETAHQVILTRGFWIMETEVTQKQWKAIMEVNPGCYRKGENLPVESISRDDVREFLKKCYENKFYIFLPSEAQWEYACRAGTEGNYSGKLDEVAWYTDNSQKKTHEVGMKKPNAWIIFDMHGNVTEMCEDSYEDSYPEKLQEIDPRYPYSFKKGSYFVIRGGNYYSPAGDCTSFFRDKQIAKDSRNSQIGVRFIMYEFRKDEADTLRKEIYMSVQ